LGGIGLGVHVNQQGPLSGRSAQGSQVASYGRFSHTAFLIKNHTPHVFISFKTTRYVSLGSMTQNNPLRFHHHPCQFADNSSPPYGRLSQRLAEYGKTSQKSTEIQAGNQIHCAMGFLLFIGRNRI
jgi:hypothetical protein